MISYLKGTIANIQKRDKRVIVILESGSIGYEMQVVPSLARQFPVANTPVQIFTHLQLRDDAPVLYGFSSAAQRDLFRQLIGVSKIGAQLAIALLDTLELQELVSAIVGGNIEVLARTPGVGRKTAERISLELRTQLKAWRMEVELEDSAAVPPAVREDVELSLLALGYSPNEVMQAIAAVAPENASNEDVEAWIKGAIAWLSRS